MNNTNVKSPMPKPMPKPMPTAMPVMPAQPAKNAGTCCNAGPGAKPHGGNHPHCKH